MRRLIGTDPPSSYPEIPLPRRGSRPGSVAARRRGFGTLLITASVLLSGVLDSAPLDPGLPAITHFRALSRQWRVDLIWDEMAADTYTVERAASPQGPFVILHTNDHRDGPAYSDFIGRPNQAFWYRVQATQTDSATGLTRKSPWSSVQGGVSTPLDADLLLTEVQEAAWRYFYHCGHPVSGLAREGIPRDPDLCATGATGMGLFNLVVGAERRFSTRSEAAERVLKCLRFLSRKALRFHGAFPHWIHGTTGAPIPFSQYDDGADLVETSYLAQGLILVREYFSASNSAESEIRALADRLWREVEWDWFTARDEHGSFLYWHWSPRHAWRMNLPIRGFNECHIAYLLAVASPAHAVPIRHYEQGWLSQDFASRREDYGIVHELGRGVGFPLFFAHYSYLGLDPHRVVYSGQSYFDHFVASCRVQQRYALSRQATFHGYDRLWGLTASLDPEGYRAHAPGQEDNGTISPTAALASMPYLPDESRRYLEFLYRTYGDRFWGAFGFYDAFNLTRDWVAPGFLGIDVGPIAPMIENHRTQLCWTIFHKAPEIRSVLRRLPDRRSLEP